MGSSNKKPTKPTSTKIASPSNKVADEKSKITSILPIKKPSKEEKKKEPKDKENTENDEHHHKHHHHRHSNMEIEPTRYFTPPNVHPITEFEIHEHNMMKYQPNCCGSKSMRPMPPSFVDGKF